MRSRLAELARRGVVPDVDYVLNHLVNRIPLAAPRMRAYAALGVGFEELGTTNIATGVEMWAGGNLWMAARSTFAQRCYIDARGGVWVGHDVSVSREALLLTATHDPDSPLFATTLAPVRLEPRSWLGVRALVMPGVTIGEGAVVAAGAVVTADVEPYTIVAGVPARPLRRRPQPLTYELDWRPNWH